jgi:hypothetical protein
MNYWSLVRRPFEIVARRPYLWLLGFLAGGSSAISYSGSGANTGHGAATYSGPTWNTLQSVWNDNWAWMTGVLALFAVVCVVMFVLGCIATGGVIRAAVEHDGGRAYGLGVAWREGAATGWRIAGLRILTGLLAIAPALFIGSLVLGVMAEPAQSAGQAAFGIATALAAVVAIVFWVVLGAAYELGQRVVVLEGGHVAESLTAGIQLIRQHLKLVGLGWLLLIGVSIVAGFGLAVVGLAAAIPAGLVGLSGWLAAGWTGLAITGPIAAVFFLGVIIAASAAYSAYSSVYWTLLYRNVRALPSPVARGSFVPRLS